MTLTLRAALLGPFLLIGGLLIGALPAGAQTPAPTRPTDDPAAKAAALVTETTEMLDSRSSPGRPRASRWATGCRRS